MGLGRKNVGIIDRLWEITVDKRIERNTREFHSINDSIFKEPVS